MAMFSLRLDDELAARFDAAALARGGRSVRLRQLIEQDAAAGEAAAPAASPRWPAGRTALRLMVRLDPDAAAHVTREAGALAMSRPGWLAALARAHATGAPRFSAEGDASLLAMQRELRRIGVNVNQIARALNTAVMEGQVLDTELTAVDALRRELAGHMQGLGEAFAGNLAYWSVGG